MKKSLHVIILIMILSVHLVVFATEKTNVTLSAKPSFYEGKCPVEISFKGKILAKFPMGKVVYRFLRSDGATPPKKSIVIAHPGVYHISETWTLGGEKLKKYSGWIQVEIISPVRLKSNRAYFEIKCRNEQNSSTSNNSNNTLNPKDDIDRDGIRDSLEEYLLKRYRPYYKFTKGENYPPTDPAYQARYAQLLKGDWQEAHSKPSIEKNCAGGEDYHVKPPSRLLKCLNGKLNLVINPKKTKYHLNLYDGKRKDPGTKKNGDWKYVKKNAPGLFGHVVKAGNLIKIEYWQYFAYNGQDLHGADHEGDWATLNLWYNPKTKKLVKVCHWAHGKGFCFDLRKKYSVKTLKNGLIEYRGENFGKKIFPLHPKSPRYPNRLQNNALRFYKYGKELHVVVYIEKDGHEFWPTSRWSYIGANKHTGNGISFLVAYIPKKMNLGELTHPMPDYELFKFKNTKKLVLRFNGYWGAWHHALNSPPPGPTLHKQWTFPSTEQDIGRLIKQSAEF